jgi:hypothetical protein
MVFGKSESAENLKTEIYMNNALNFSIIMITQVFVGHCKIFFFY